MTQDRPTLHVRTSYIYIYIYMAGHAHAHAHYTLHTPHTHTHRIRFLFLFTLLVRHQCVRASGLLHTSRDHCLSGVAERLQQNIHTSRDALDMNLITRDELSACLPHMYEVRACVVTHLDGSLFRSLTCMYMCAYVYM